MGKTIAEKILSMFAEAGIQAHANSTRPRDHGVWMPLLHLYPEADIPVVEISLPMSYSAEEIFKIGQTLKALRQQQILFFLKNQSLPDFPCRRWCPPPLACLVL